MGTLIGHVGPGFGFFVVGLWHLINHIRLHSRNPRAYTSPPWFPSSHFLRYLELYLIMAASSISIAMELFIGPANHQPLDPSDWSIPSYHLHNFEHSSISLTFLLYALFAVLLDRRRPPAAFALTQLLAAAAFSQQFLMFHLHSSDHMGVEGQYHWLLQLVIAVSLATTVLGIGWPRSFAVSFVRSASILFQGLWLMVMGFMLWTPGLIAKGCFMNLEEGHMVVRCHGEEALHRAKSLVNIQFSWFLAGVASSAALLYVIMAGRCSAAAEAYVPLVMPGSDDDDDDLEGQQHEEEETKKIGQSHSFVEMGKAMRVMEVER